MGSIDWNTTALNTSTFVAIDLPDQQAGYVTLYADDGSIVYLAKDVSGTDVRPTLEYTPENWGIIDTPYGSSKTVVWAKGSIADTNLVVLYNKK